EPDHAAGSGRTIKRLNNAYVSDPLRARWLGIFVVKNTIGEINQLGRKLITLAECLLAALSFNGNGQIDRVNIFVSLLQPHVPFRTDHATASGVRRAEARGKGRQAAFREAQQSSGHLVDFFEPDVTFVCAAEGEDFGGLCGK